MKRPLYQNEAIETAQMAFETGQFCCEREDFSSKKTYDYYCELMELGPAGFYEEFKDELDFDEDFIAEYGDEYIPSSTNGDYSPSNPWDAPGMSIKDFI